MRLLETSVLYGIIGVVVAIALGLSERPGDRRWYLYGVWVVAWPFFAPFVLARATTTPKARTATADPRLCCAEARLLEALGHLEGVAGEVLAPEVDRVQNMTVGLARMQVRISEMDAVLDTDSFDLDGIARELDAIEAETDPRRDSLQARHRSVQRLRELRDHTAKDYEGSLLQMEEMGAQLHLLRFSEKPEQGVLDRVRDLSARIEGVTEGIAATG